MPPRAAGPANETSRMSHVSLRRTHNDRKRLGTRIGAWHRFLSNCVYGLLRAENPRIGAWYRIRTGTESVPESGWYRFVLLGRGELVKLADVSARCRSDQ